MRLEQQHGSVRGATQRGHDVKSIGALDAGERLDLATDVAKDRGHSLADLLLTGPTHRWVSRVDAHELLEQIDSMHFVHFSHLAM